MESINVLQIGLEWFPERGGGLDRYYHDLVHFAHSDTMRCTGLVAGSGQSDKETGGRIHSFVDPKVLLPRRLMAARAAIRNQLRNESPDLVVSHFAMHVLPALDLIHVPLVVHFHGPWASESLAQRGHRRWIAEVKLQIEKLVYRRADRLVVLSEAFAVLLNETYGVPRERIVVVPGLIDVDRFARPTLARRTARETLNWPSDRRILLTVRRLVRRMGLEQLIEATAQVITQHPDLLLMIAGSGPEHEMLHAQITAAGLTHHVKLLGFLPDSDLPMAYRAADCSIVPTQTLEGFGLIVAESLAAGTPALVTPVGGLPEVVMQLSPELVLGGCEPSDIVTGLRGWLAGNLHLPDEKTCRDYAGAMFSWVNGAEILTQQYRSVLKK